MSMSSQPAGPTPQPNCADFEALLPLLRLSELDEADETNVRQHVAACAWCQAQLDQYDGLRTALRRHYGTEQNAPLTAPLAFDAIAERARSDRRDPIREDDARPALSPLPLMRRPRLSALAALAATLLLAILAAALFRSRSASREVATVAGLGTLEAFPLPAGSSQPSAIVAGRDGALWFAEVNKIGRITTNGVITEYPLPSHALVNGLVYGPDGAIWFADGAGKIGRLSPRDGAVTEFALPTPGAKPAAMVAGSDGAVWFTALLSPTNSASWEIGRITIHGVITEYPLRLTVFSGVIGMTLGPDGAIWFIGASTPTHDVIGRISASGAMTLYPIPALNTEPSIITAGPDGALWFNGGASMPSQFTPANIGRMTQRGAVTLFPLSGVVYPPNTDMGAIALAVGPDGVIWFVFGDDQTLGRVTPAGAITVYALPTTFSAFSLVTGSDGAFWFTDTAHNAIDRLQLARSK